MKTESMFCAGGLVLVLGAALSGCGGSSGDPSSGLVGRDGPGKSVSWFDSGSSDTLEINNSTSLVVEEDPDSDFPLRATISGGPTGEISEPIYGTDSGEGNYYSFREDPITTGGQIFLSNSEKLGLNYSSYGIWQNATSSPFESTGGGFGQVTSVSSIPSTSAIYNGESIGVLRGPGVEVYISDVTVTTDFTNLTMQAQNTRTIESGTSNSDLDFTVPGVVSGSTFAGSGTTAGGLAGGISGQFNGPNGEEVSGGFGFQDLGPGFSFYNGGFGAKR